MDESADVDAEFWRAALLAGGFTPIPRWTLNPEPGVAAYEAAIAGDLVAGFSDCRTSSSCRSAQCC